MSLSSNAFHVKGVVLDDLLGVLSNLLKEWGYYRKPYKTREYPCRIAEEETRPRRETRGTQERCDARGGRLQDGSRESLRDDEGEQVLNVRD